VLPNFLVIGAMKAGTTSLYNYLCSNPQVFMPGEKELDFFVAECNWNRGVGWYEQLFEGAEGAVAVGEASPKYTTYPRHEGVPARVAKLIPDARLIYLVRHPIERIVSHYRLAVRMTPRLASKPLEETLLHRTRVDASRYAMQIEQYLQYFPREQLLIIKSEDLKQARAATVRRIFEFIGVDSSSTSADLETEYNMGRDIRAARRFVPMIARLPGYKAVASATPASIKTLKRRVTSRKITRDFRIPDNVLRDLQERLRPDIKLLRSYMDEGFDGWGLA
jgi:hypothetical protein